MASRQIVIVGAFHEVIELAERADIGIYGLIDNEKTGSYRGYTILGNDNDAEHLYEQLSDFPLILTPDDPHLRFKLHHHYAGPKYMFATLIAKCAEVSKSASIGLGSMLQSGTTVSAESRIGAFVKLNTNSTVMHDCRIGDYTTIAPHAVLLGKVDVGSMCYIGANSTILPYLSVCDDTTIGAGAVVTKSIFEAGIYIGVPARRVGN